MLLMADISLKFAFSIMQRSNSHCFFLKNFIISRVCHYLNVNMYALKFWGDVLEER